MKDQPVEALKRAHMNMPKGIPLHLLLKPPNALRPFPPNCLKELYSTAVMYQGWHGLVVCPRCMPQVGASVPVLPNIRQT